jgi:DNA-binding beta-propeller fold protein YncE
VDAQNGNLFISQVNRGAIAVLGVRSGAVKQRTVLPQNIGYMALDGPANRVFVPSYGPTSRVGTLSVLDATTGALVRSVRVGVYPIAAAVDEQTRRVFVVNSGNGTRTEPGSITVLNATC